MKKAINLIDPNLKVAGVSLLELKKTEKALGVLFPEEYKELFLETNGATFGDWVMFPLPSKENPTSPDHILKQNEENRPVDLPNDMICIGENKEGHRICYRIRKRFLQELIFVWDAKSKKSDYKAWNLSEFIGRYTPKRNPDQPKKMGTFTVESGQLIVTDPAYDMTESDIQVILNNVKNGEWTGSITYDEEESVESLRAFYKEKKPTGRWHDCDQPIGVDSAQAGIFDCAVYGKEESIPYEVENIHDLEFEEEMKYYIACCDVVASDAQGGIVPGGIVSMSGYGDGMYDVKVKYNKSKEVVGVMINFGDEE